MTEWVQHLNEHGRDNYGRPPRSLRNTSGHKDAHEYFVYYVSSRTEIIIFIPLTVVISEKKRSLTQSSVSSISLSLIPSLQTWINMYAR